MLEAKQVGKQFNGQWLFRNVNLSLNEGQILGIQGASGCGKSTFCRILATMQLPDEGAIALEGVTAQRRGYNPIQLVFQQPETAVNPRWRAGRIMKEGWEPDSELLEALQIDSEWLTRRPSELSGGQLQRICIARSLAPQTRYLLADEMTTMLDSITQSHIWKAVLSIAEERRMGILVVSHDKHLLHRVCSDVLTFPYLTTG